VRARAAALCQGLLLLGITVGAYLPVFHAGFLHDDDELVSANPILHRGGRGFGPEAWGGLRELWLPDLASITTFHEPGIPVTATVLWLEWRLFGTEDPRANPADRGLGAPAYHVVNLLLHALCALLLWRLLDRLAIAGAWFAALLWAVHPLCVESVAWISELKNTLSMTFLLASGLAWKRWSETRHRAGWTLSLIAFLLALLSKPSVAPFPVVLLLIEWWGRRPLGAALRAALPSFALALAAGVVAVSAQTALAIRGEALSVGSPLARIEHASFAIGFYAWKALAPFDLLPIYPRWHETLPWAVQIAPGVLFALMLGESWRARERWGRHAILSIGGFVVMLSPALGLIPISYLRHTLVADHFAYHALPFAMAGIAAPAAAWCRRAPPLLTWLRTAAAAVVTLFAWQTFAYAATFHDGRTLWTHTLERNPDAWLAHDQLGALLMEDGRYEPALAHFERAVEIAPQIAEPHNNLAVALDHLGQGERAVEEIQKAAALTPDDPYVRLNCATGLVGAGRPREALPHFEAAFELLARRRLPEDPAMRTRYGAALLQSGRPRAAIDQFQHVLAIDPERPAARRLLAAAQRMASEMPPAPLEAAPP